MEVSEVNIQGEPGALVYLIVLPFIIPLCLSSAFETLRRTLFRRAVQGDQCGWPSTSKLLRLLDVTATDCRKGPHRLTLGLQRLHWNVYVGRPRLSDSSGGLSLQTEGDKLPHSAFWAAGYLWTYDLVFLFSDPRTPGRGGTSNYQPKKKTKKQAIFSLRYPVRNQIKKPLRGSSLNHICLARRPFTLSTGAVTHSAAKPVPFPIVSLHR